MFHRIELTEALVTAAVESMARGTAGDDASARPGFPNLDGATRAMAQKRFWEIRRRDDIEKKPSTAELLAWLCILSALRVEAATLEQRSWRDMPGIAALIKDGEDLRRLQSR
jgi:hypothetical protein